jgi:DNA-binding GntR family transcriptional regulator
LNSQPLDLDSSIVLANAYEAVTDKIRLMIITRQFAPGEWLRPRELANTLGVSATPVREALRALEADGQVEFFPRRGARVVQLSFEAYEEIQAVRAALEVVLCRYLAEDMSKLSLPALADLLVKIEGAEDRKDYGQRVRLVRQFFFTIYEASGKSHLIRILSGLWDILAPYVYQFSSLPETVTIRTEYFRKIYAACAAQDIQALSDIMQSMNIWATNSVRNALSD